MCMNICFFFGGTLMPWEGDMLFGQDPAIPKLSGLQIQRAALDPDVSSWELKPGNIRYSWEIWVGRFDRQTHIYNHHWQLSFNRKQPQWWKMEYIRKRPFSEGGFYHLLISITKSWWSHFILQRPGKSYGNSAAIRKQYFKNSH